MKFIDESFDEINESLAEFLKKESAGGLILMFATVLALIVANSPLNGFYQQLTSTPVVIAVGDLIINKPLLLWINDGLMAVFFFLVGLELKRELMEGALANPKDVVFPMVGAVGGMLVPALIYVYFNQHNPLAMQGWAIPAATDIAFALGILALLGSRVPVALKIFLVTLAIIDDIGAILIIAMFYTSKISATALLIAAICTIVLGFMNYRHVSSVPSYILVGVILWVSLLKSGVHATLGGVILAMFIPMRDKDFSDYSPVKHLEHSLHPAVGFFILPIFAFANAGISFGNVSQEAIFNNVNLGIMLGLFVGKQLGVFGFCWLAVKAGLTSLPASLTWRHVYGCAILCGVGFTMSLFIGSLAFQETSGDFVYDERVGILAGSIISGIVGYLLLATTKKVEQSAN